MRKYLITDVTTEELTLSEAKEHLRVFDDSEDSYISSLIITSRKIAENITSNYYGEQTVKLTFSREDDLRNMICLANPFIEIASVIVDGKDITAYKIRDNKLYFDEILDYDELEIIHTVGKDLPYPVKAGMLLLIGHLYENREANVDVEIYNLPFGIERLFGLDKVYL